MCCRRQPAEERQNSQPRTLSEGSPLGALLGSFSAVSKPNFASKYAFESSRKTAEREEPFEILIKKMRLLHNALLCTVLEAFSNPIFMLETLLFSTSYQMLPTFCRMLP
jgi:hypothetical protein